MTKNKIGKKTLLLGLIFFGIFVISGCGCKKAQPKQYKLSLEIWGTFDDRDNLAEIIANYRKINPAVTNIEYKKLTPDTYKQELLDALASGQGPDIFLLNSAWIPQFKDKTIPAPNAQGIVNEQRFRDNFVDVAINDFVEEGKIYAVPLSMNSLGLFYNKDLFNQAGIVSPPKNWNEFIDDVRLLTKLDEFGNITQSGAAIGTAYNINRSTDVLNLLMFQTGTEMTNNFGNAIFGRGKIMDGQNVSPGESALNFYTQFAKLKSLNYCWNSSLHYSLDAFSEGTVAMMFNYPWHIKTIRDKNPKLNFAVAPVPQFENSAKVNFASYWGYAVAKNKIAESFEGTAGLDKNTIRAEEAWKFLTYLTVKPDGNLVADSSSGANLGVKQTVDFNFDPAEKYAQRSQSPSARRDIIEKQKNDPEIGVFAVDNLIAKSWKQKDSQAMEIIFAEMIEAVVKGQTTVTDAIHSAEQRVNNL